MKLKILHSLTRFLTFFFIGYLAFGFIVNVTAIPKFPKESDSPFILTENYIIVRGTGFPKTSGWEVVTEDNIDYNIDWRTQYNTNTIGYAETTVYTLFFNNSYSEEWGLCEYRKSFELENGSIIYDQENSSFTFSKDDHKIKIPPIEYANSLLRIAPDIEINEFIDIYDFLEDKIIRFKVYSIVPSSWNNPGEIVLYWDEHGFSTWKNITLTFSPSGKFQSRLIQELDNATDMDLFRIRFYAEYLTAELENIETIDGYFPDFLLIFILFGSVVSIYHQKRETKIVKNHKK